MERRFFKVSMSSQKETYNTHAVKHLNSTIDKNNKKSIACCVSSKSYDDDCENESTNSISS